MYGPLEYVVIQFNGSRFTGEILPSLLALEEQGCVWLVDLVFISKDEVGDVTLLEISDLDAEEAAAYAPVIDEFHSLFTPEDIAAAAAGLPANSSAAVLLLEHGWAVDLQQAVFAAGGQMVDSGYINLKTQAVVLAEVEQMEVDDAR